MDSELKSLKKRLSQITAVDVNTIDEKTAFCITFVRLFVADTPNYDLGNGAVGATRSNWTYHTAFAIAQTAKMFNWTCKFECSGKRDAVIETKDDSPIPLLYAEWEWDYRDIFGTGKELEKLRDSCKKSKTAEAFLLVYCPVGEFPDFLSKIVTYWQRAFSRIKIPPSLFLNTITFKQHSGYREFDSFNLSVVDLDYVRILDHVGLQEAY